MRLALMVLVLLAPVAAAAHPFPSAQERLEQGAAISVHLAFEGGATAKGSTQEDDRANGLGTVREDEHDWRSAWEWTAAGWLSQGEGPGFLMLAGNASVEFEQVRYRETTTVFRRDETRVTTSRGTTECSAEGVMGGLMPGSFRLEGSEVVIRFQEPTVPLPEDACRATLEETDTHGGETNREEWTNPLYDVAYTTKSEEEGTIELRVPVGSGKTVILESHSSSLPPANEELGGRLCGRLWPATDLVVPCRAEGTIEVHLFVEPCDALVASATRHRQELEAAAASPPSGGGESELLAWADEVAARTSALLADERHHQLFGCTPPMQDNLEAALDGLVKVRDALGKAAAEGKLSEEGKRRLLGAERATQLMGGPEASGEAATGLEQVIGEARNVPGRLTAGVSVHSPVALRAVSLDGAIIGWTDTASPTPAPEGASATGEPGGHQRLVLPEGGYFVEVAEQAPGPYLLVFEGPDGEETHLVQAIPGRVTRIPMLVQDAGRGPELLLFAPTRTGVADGAPAGAAANDGQAEDAPEGERAASTPAGAVAAALVALVVVALGRRR